MENASEQGRQGGALGHGHPECPGVPEQWGAAVQDTVTSLAWHRALEMLNRPLCPSLASFPCDQ